MQSKLYTSLPSSISPFKVEAIQYLPAFPCEDGFTLVFFHATALHKETFAPMLSHLFASSTNIKDVWCIDNPNQGRSSALNQELLRTPYYRGTWSATEYARGAYSFLSSTVHGVDFTTRRVIGLAHSSAVAALMILIGDKRFASPPAIRFASLILLDVALLPPEHPSTSALSQAFGKFALKKQDRWPTRAAAYQYLATNPMFKGWDPNALHLFVDCALRDSGSEVVLACSKAQEAGFFLSPSPDYTGPPVEIFRDLVRKDELPMHLITCLKDEYRGLSLPMKEFQIAEIKTTKRGSVQILERGGHMFPQVEPVLCADAVQHALFAIQGEKKARL